MGLISVNQPHPQQRKKSMFEQVSEGIQLANQVLGLGLKGYELYQKGDENDIKKAAVETDILKNFQEVPNDTPGASTIMGKSYKPRSDSLDINKVGQLYKDGLIDPVTPEEAAKLKEAGKPPMEFPIKGSAGPTVTLYGNPSTKFIEKLNADLEKTKAEATKLTAEAEKIKNGSDEDTIKSINELSQQRQRSQLFQNANTARVVLDQIDRLKQNPNGASDIGIMTLFAKAADPTSVVKEGEFDRAKLVGTLGDKGGAIFNTLTNGQQLTDEQRKQIIGASEALAAGHIYLGLKEDKGIAAEAFQRNINPKRVIREYDPNDIPDLMKKYAPKIPDNHDDLNKMYENLLKR